MNDVDSLSLSYYPVSSPDISSPNVSGDADGSPVSFSQCKLDSDEQSIRCAIFLLFTIGDIPMYWMN